MRLIPLGVFRPAARSPGRRPIRVSFVIDQLGRAGTEGQLLALLRHLDRSRVHPTLCVLRGDDTEAQAHAPADCPTLALGLDKLCSRRAPTAAVRLLAFWRQHRAEVIQTYFLDSTYFAAPLARLCGIRRVVRVRNNTGYWLTPAHRRTGRLVGRLCPITLANSYDARRALAETEGIPSHRIRVIENGVDLERFSPDPAPDTGRAIVRIGTVANLRPVKNVEGLLRVSTRICRTDPRIQVEVAGEGGQRLDLECRIRASGLAERVRLLGSVTDIPAFLATLDVAVLPSHSESMSNALLEYMAAGRAIVATDVGANARLVRAEREGLIVPPGDDVALERAIRRYLECPPLARDLGAAARTRAREYSRESMVRRFEDFFVSLAEE
jgi:glycosyltransferase involved in cell wall biosynthesis